MQCSQVFIFFPFSLKMDRYDLKQYLERWLQSKDKHFTGEHEAEAVHLFLIHMEPQL